MPDTLGLVMFEEQVGPADESIFLDRTAVDVAVEALRLEYSLLEAAAVADDHLRYA